MKPKATPTPSNVAMEVKDGFLYVGIKLDTRLGQSKSGKTILIGTTHGIVQVPGTDVQLSVNAFVK
jgi:hypothetical protein